MVREHLGFMRALLPYDQNGLVDECYKLGRVHKVEYREEGIYIEAELVANLRSKLARYALEE